MTGKQWLLCKLKKIFYRMIRTRKEMWTYIHKDMERNLISRGGKVLDKDSFESSALFHP